MLKFYRKKILASLFLMSGIMFLFSALLNIMVAKGTIASFQVMVAGLLFLDAYIFSKPYLAINNKRLIIYRGIIKPREILFSDLIIEQEKEKLMILANKTTGQKYKIYLKAMDKMEALRFSAAINDAFN